MYRVRQNEMEGIRKGTNEVIVIVLVIVIEIEI